MSDVNDILANIDSADPSASEKLLPLVYDELRKLACSLLVNERPGQTLQPTALVHEAYLRLVNQQQLPQWNSRGHFFAAAAEAMRRILVDQARRKGAAKNGGLLERVGLDDGQFVAPDRGFDLMELDDALTALAAKEPRKAELVKLRFFAGLTNVQAAEALNISESTAEADWRYARAWLQLQMRK